MFLQHQHLALRVVEHLARCGAVGHQLAVALLLQAGLAQLLARGGCLPLHVGLLAFIDLPRGHQLLHLQPRLRGVNECHLLALCYAVALADDEREQGAALLGNDGGLRGLEGTGGIVGLLAVGACCHDEGQES